MPIGSLAIAILLHVPYVRRAGMWPFGEYQLYRAICDGIVPVLEAIRELQAGGIAPRFTVALSPLVAEQLSDLLLRTGFEEFMLRRLSQAEEDARSADADLAAAAVAQKARDERVLLAFFEEHRRDLVRSLREVEHAGAIEAIAYPATGAVLPLLPRVSARRAQVLQGLRAAEQHLEHAVAGMWLPGGAVAPGAEGESINDLLTGSGVTYTFVGEKALRGPMPGLPGMEGAPRSALDPQRLSDGLVALVRHGEFAAFVDSFAGQPEYFGPADPLGRRYWRRGGMPPDLAAGPGALEITVGAAPHDAQARRYDPSEAEGLWKRQAAAAVVRARELLAAHKDRTGRGGVLCLTLDARRFSAWPEGVPWLTEFVRQAHAAGIKLESGAEAVHRHQLQSLPDLTPSSWEGEGDFRVWQADNTTWYWEAVATTLDHAESLADRFGGVGNPLLVRMLAQATREALLLIAGEWPEMIGRGGEELDYAAERVREHLDRFRRLAYMLDTANPEEMDTPLLERYEALDNPFQSIDLGLLSADQHLAARDAPPGHRPWSGMGPGGVI
ncbi:MAG: DUF1957 domain-containing protein [Candidatus Sericytochromatia bacterium]|nr:DUF1957 domain-containing protein [Candidatus Tanganyikabacteria bacterium]